MLKSCRRRRGEVDDKAAAPRKLSEAATDGARTNASLDVCPVVHATFKGCGIPFSSACIFTLWYW
jgi:hypothetical protein